MSGFSKVRFLSSTLFVALLVCLTIPGFAESQDSVSRSTLPRARLPMVDLANGVAFELTPHTGVMGGSGTFGLKMTMSTGSFSLELAGEQVIGKTGNLYPIFLNVMLNLATRGRLIPYGTVGAGLMLTIPTNALGAETVSTLGISFGGGARYFITRSFGVRLEGKQYITSVSSKRDLKDELLFFQEISAGVTFLIH